jgi:hypothetical protein
MELEPRPDEVTVIQYLRPFGTKSKVFAPVGEDYVAKAKGMILSSEVLRTGEVMIYARWEDEAEEKEINAMAFNGPGFNGPTESLKKLIDRKLAERKIDLVKAAQKIFGVKK